METIQVPQVRAQVLLAKTVLDEKGLLDYTANLHFYKGELFAGNDKMVFISPSTVQSDFSVNGTDFCRVLDGMGEDAELQIRRGRLSIRSDSATANLSLYKPEQGLEWIETSGLKTEHLWKNLPEDFWEAVNWCKFSVSKDMTVRPLTCVNINGYIVRSTDNLRASVYEMSEAFDQEVFLPKESLPALVKFPEMTQYSLVKPVGSKYTTWILFRNPKENLIAGSRIIIGKFPEVEQLFTKGGQIIDLPEGLLTMVARAGRFTEGIVEESRRITLQTGEGFIVCSASKPTGNFEQKIPFNNPADFNFDTVPSLLEQILSRTNQVRLAGNRMIFDLEKFSHVVIISTKNEEENDIPF